MRYALVTETYPPEVNGVALTVQGLALGLCARGHAVEVVRPRQPTDSGGEAGNENAIAALRVRGASLPRYPGLRLGLPATGTLLKHWTHSPPDAIYVATEGPLGWSALRAATRLGIPVASGFHTRFDRYMRDYGLQWLEGAALAWMRRFHNRADATLVPTIELRDFLQARGFRRVVRLARAVDTAHLTPMLRDAGLRDTWGAGADTLVAIHVGRIAPEKNLDLAVRAFRALQARRPDARFVWVGDGPSRGALARDNPDFVFCGTRHGTDLARHFASGDLFLFPSRSETFGNVTLEAMASGVPTVAFDSGAAREHLCDGIHGARVADEAGFIDAAVRLSGDGPVRIAMGRAARAAMLRLRPERVAADFDALLAALGRQGERDAALAA
ncbi:glycosyl transferase [Pseudoxanthomonas broegbernensis]|uniref:Glycosyl transferase n=1 Tax=Pseudoxanthomonas broegbernensis TaxID=83619 RepID=A0A7V8GQ86_9GAMM|nr:glycosyltransferase family 1 protein [Pseudoxanthomonas broegbernensis]KAF1688136.1 glycosyl transferase [Pseudoxanthomonas broegbernensis]MBB6065185.1 glycosyltransferase involved in cell wall biosynthesis [Pseudoxanthomonas broegbernensis]